MNCTSFLYGKIMVVDKITWQQVGIIYDKGILLMASDDLILFLNHHSTRNQTLISIELWYTYQRSN